MVAIMREERGRFHVFKLKTVEPSMLPWCLRRVDIGGARYASWREAMDEANRQIEAWSENVVPHV